MVTQFIERRCHMETRTEAPSVSRIPISRDSVRTFLQDAIAEIMWLQFTALMMPLDCLLVLYTKESPQVIINATLRRIVADGRITLDLAMAEVEVLRKITAETTGDDLAGLILEYCAPS